MRKIKWVIPFFCIGLITACSYKDDELVATFRGQNIYVLDLKKTSEVSDEDIPEVTQNYVFREAVVLEAKERGITVSAEEIDNEIAYVFNNYEQLGLEDITKHLKNQAKKYNMSYEDYLNTVYREEIEKSRYVIKMMDEIFDVQSVDEMKNIGFFQQQEQQFQEWYSAILEKYQDDIEFYYY
ncbi:hypothetical protein SAMN05421736_101303 [Evansella caseinilytica]|uniref:SurA-like protein n=1 Tax=Evansella caseinilytica TaxID=1503961 RepID=A0A1H3GWM5_9BACI|nr:hypothetical protein [Evansella caseinilytica]SDY07517.1 hypothetical protein SAMN05421736_101303 [Evansella caseinilytica]